MILRFTLTAGLLFASMGTAATAQDTSAGLPAICTVNAGMDHGAHDSGAAMAMTGDAAHQALMAGMDAMNSDMMAGGTATDIDVAFVCAMIPHHRGAISMAKAELQHGDDAWAKSLAEQVIAAQEKEIADMLAWLEKQPQ
jgi:uncharacterized protein (DUF305 family)